MATGTAYVAGMCNIGGAERGRRARAGWVGVAVTVVVLVALVVLKASPWFYLVLFFPAFMAAIGFVQAAYGFCVGFARRGVYNFAELGTVETVRAETDRGRDRSTSSRLTGLSLLIGAGVALIAFGLALAFT